MTAPAGGTLGSAIVRVSADVTRFARGVQMAVQRELSRISWARFNAAASRAGRDAGRGLGQAFGNGVKGIMGILGKMNPMLLKIGRYALIAGAALKSIGTAGPAIGGVLTLLGAMAATLPALIVTGLLVSKTLTMAFKGVGEAMKAAAEGDAAALEEAIKDLSPSAQGFVREVAKISPQFKQLQKDVQESFFAPMKGAFTALFNPGTMSALRGAMTGIAESFGRAGAGIAKIIGDAGKTGQLKSIFAPLERAVERVLTLAPGLTTLFLSFADHAAPIIEAVANLLTTKLGGFFDKANDWVIEGGLAEFFETAGEVAGVLFSVLGDIGRIFKSLFSTIAGEGGGAIGVLGTLLDQLASFLESAEGAELLNTLSMGLKELAEIVAGVLLPLLPLAAKLLGSLFVPLMLVLNKVKQPLIDLVTAMANMLMPVVEELGPVFMEIGEALSSTLVELFGLLTRHIIEMTPVAKTMAQTVGPVLVLFFSHLGTALVEMMPLLQNFAALLVRLSPAFKVLGGVLAAAILILTAAVFVIGKLGLALAWLQDVIFDWVKSDGWRLFLDIYTLFPKVIIAAVEWIINGWTWAINATQNAWNAITGTVSAGVEKVSAFIGSLPGRVAAFAGSMFNAAASLGAAIGRGLSNIGNFASDIGGKIVGTIKSGINAVIASINNGIARIDAVIPGSLPRMSFFERGGIVDEPTMSVLGEKHKREVVLPLTDRARTLQLAQESGLIDMLRGSGVGGGGVPVVNVTAILDGFGVLQVVDQRVEVKMNDQGRELAAGTRGI
jgi:phage-related protein